jgi:choline kinase
MKAIILAAGEGRRLHPLTIDKPKALLDFAGRTLLERALENLRSTGIKDSEIIILSGHAANKLKAAARRCIFIHNERYDSTNNIYSLWLARKQIAGEEFMLLNSDVLFAPELAQKILADGRESVLMVDDVNPLVAEEMRVTVDGKGRITAIAKTIDEKRSVGEYIGLARFGAVFSQAFFKRMDEMIQAGQTHVWYENAIADILADYPIYSLSTQGLPWIEIDTHEDLACAAEIAQEIDKMEV